MYTTPHRDTTFSRDTTFRRMERVKTRVLQYRRRSDIYFRSVFSALCILFSFMLLNTIISLSGIEHSGEVSGMVGAVLLHENIGSYILVGIISFIIAVVITYLCIRYRQNNKQK